MFYHIPSELNCADLNYKIPGDCDPIRIEIEMWRNGLTDFLNTSAWPPQESINQSKDW